MAEAVTTVAISVSAKISEYSVKPVLGLLRPIFCFQSIVNDFKSAKTKLKDIYGTVESEVRHATNNGRVTLPSVTDWLTRVDELMAVVERLDGGQLEANHCSWCPNWTWNCKFSSLVLETTNAMKRLCDDGNFRSVAHPAPPLHQHIVGSSSTKAFMHSQSSKSAFDQIKEALEKDDVNIIGLYGDDGMGKTALAKQVGEEARKQFEHVILVSVSKPPQVTSMQDVIADFLELSIGHLNTDQARAAKLQQRLKNGEKILIIFDDVQKEFNLEAVIGIPSCKILFTAHSISDVPDGLQTLSNFHLEILSEDEAWALLQSITGIGDEVREHDAAKHAIAECKGCPKSLVKLGSVLKGKSLPEWDDALEPLRVSKHKVTEDLEEQAKKLSLRREGVETEIKKAKDNAEEINKDVDNWLQDVEKAMKDKEQFMNEFNKSTYFFDEHGDLTKSKELTNIVQKLWAEGDFLRVSHVAPIHQVMGSSSSPDFMFSQSAKSAFNQILEALQKDDVNIIGLYGMGGIGKTTLAEQVQKEVKRINIFDHAVIVPASQRPEVGSIQDTIAELLSLKLEQKTEEGRASKLNQRFKDGKILLILDDIWQRFDLKTIGIMLDECKGCKVLLTTRRKNVPESMGCKKNIQLNLLSEDEAREFFMKKACVSEEELKWNKLTEEIVAQCKGLPIALAAVGAALRNKGEDEWREALDSLRYSRPLDIVGVDNDEQNAYKCLRFSYDYLTHSQQFILLLCSLNPEDRFIEVEALSRHAFGMRLFHQVESIEVARRKVRVTIRVLKDSSLLLDGYSENSVKVHDVVRDVILWIGGTEAREKNVLTVRDESDLKEFIRNNSFQNCRAVSFMAESVAVLSKYNQLDCPNLETIMIFGGEHTGVELPNEFFQHMTFLKVLELQQLPFKRFDMPQSLCNLKGLRALMLDYCVCSNSSILCELRNLEILSLKESEIDCGVEIVSGLKELRLLDLTDSRKAREYPSNMIEALSKLEELHGHVIRKCEVGEGRMEDSSRSIEWELLSNLVSLSVQIEDGTCIPMGFCFPNLATYFIRLGIMYTNKSQSSASRMRCLELGRFEDETAMINICKKLLPTVLELHLLGWTDLCSLTVFTSHAKGLFQRLKILEIEECNKMERVFEFGEDKNISNNISTIGQLQFLKALRLIRLDKLKHVWKGPTRSVSLRNLTEIDIWRCSKLTCVFPSPLLATSLQQLESLSIVSRNDLEEIISRRGDCDGDDLDNIQGVKAEDGKEEPVICFQKLKTLEIKECGKLKTIFPISVAFPKLQRLKLEHNAELEHVLFGQSDWDCTWPYPLLEYLIVVCPKLCKQFVAACIKNLSTTKAKKITLGDIQGVEDVMQIERSHLEKLSLQNLQHLKCIWRGPTQNVCFVNLCRLEVIGCNRLTHISDTTIATILPKLTELIIGRCNELEQVVVMAENGKELTTGVVFENLRTLDVSECQKLRTIFPISIALPKLERLRIERNAGLEHAFGQSDKDCIWKYPFLKNLRLVGCPKLCAQFAVVCIQNLSTRKHIRRIELEYIQGVEELIQLQSQNVNQEGDNQFDDIEDADCDLLFSSLETLSLRNIAELKCIWHGPTQNICFASLSEIKVIGCNGLKHVFTTAIAGNLPKLKKLIVRRCNEIEQVIMVDNDGKEERENDAKAEMVTKVGFESLEVLYVSNCEKLKTIFSIFIPLPKLECLRLESNAQLESLFGQPDCVDTLCSAHLETLSVTSCPKLCKEFIAMIRSKLQPRSTSQVLRVINLSSIQGVKEVVDFHRQDYSVERQYLKLEELGDLKRIWSGPTQDISFSYLCALRVIGCSRLKQLFTTTMASSLHNLFLLSVERCHDLQHIIEEEGDEENNTQSVQRPEFSNLEILRLIDLPKLISFCSTSCNLLLPLLAEKNLIVEGCQKSITEFFSQQSYKQDNEMKYLYEFDDPQDEDGDSDKYYFSQESLRKLFGYRAVEKV